MVDGFVESIAGEPEMRRRLTRIIVQTPALRASWLAAGRQAQDDLVELFQRERPDLGPLAVRGLAAATIASLTVAVESWAIGESPSAREAASDALSPIAPALASRCFERPGSALARNISAAEWGRPENVRGFVIVKRQANSW